MELYRIEVLENCVIFEVNSDLIISALCGRNGHCSITHL